MQNKSKQECCNGDCRQGRDCPNKDGYVPGFAPIVITFLVVMLTLMTIKTFLS